MRKKSICSFIVIIFVALFCLANVSSAKETKIVSDFFRISKVEQKSNNKVIVYFTQPVNSKAERPEAFSLVSNGKVLTKKADINVSVLSDSPYVLEVFFKKLSIKPGAEYTLKVSELLTSAFGETISLGFDDQSKGDQIKFTGGNFEELKLVNAISLSDRKIQLDFSTPISQASGKQISNYTVVNTDTSKTVNVINAVISDNSYGAGCRVILTTAKLVSNKTYDITISNISDVKKQYLIKKQKISFKVLDNSAITKVVSIEPLNTNTIIVKFNRNLDPAHAKDVSNYVINGPYKYEWVRDSSGVRCEYYYKAEQPVKAYYSNDYPDSVILYFWYDCVFMPFSRCTLTISKDLHTGLALTPNSTFEFEASNVLKKSPEISNATLISRNKIRVDFNTEISQSGLNIQPGNYHIEYINDDSIKIPSAVSYYDGKTIVLKFDNDIDIKKQYFLAYYRLIDATAEIFSGEQIKTMVLLGK